MANRKKQIEKIQKSIEPIIEEVEGLIGELEEAFENMPASLQYNSPQSEKMQERIDMMRDWSDQLQSMTEEEDI